ncbi:NUDIX hydrolase [Acidiphilium iwatense]|uniref:NUDIX hydrolase n=1 Tax=Acidiphilium iwatense TaxID=768198 RepID=A0ABS9DV81_9PROT|nr:NUDIX hydrolase [Acidiphilium iwatense]MCF3946643.1 NUDIX hydrolase [Acidiphilium iwatense]
MTIAHHTAGIAPVTPRSAASLLVLRGGAAGAEVLMGRRSANHRFMPNRLVFPGGAVDPGDTSAPAESELSPHVFDRLRLHVGAGLARALAIAGTRELHEETGLSLGVPPRLDALDYIYRAITPPASPVRFDAFFFTVPAIRVTGTIAGSGELKELRYYGIEEALELDLAFVTRAVLGHARQWLALGATERIALGPVPVLREQRWRES